MDQTTDSIRAEIDRRREAMTRDVNEIEGRAREMTDWEHQFRQRPLTMVALAFGGGVLLGTLLSGSSDDDEKDRKRSEEQRYRSFEPQGAYGWDQYRTERGDGRDEGGMMGWMTGERGPTQRTEAAKQRAAGKIDEVRGALMALAATKAEDFLREALPGFQSEVEKLRQQVGSEDDSRQAGVRESTPGHVAAPPESLRAESGYEQHRQI